MAHQIIYLLITIINIDLLNTKLSSDRLLLRLNKYYSYCKELENSSVTGIKNYLQNLKLIFNNLDAKIKVLDPAATLEIGSGIIKKNDSIISSCTEVNSKEKLTIALSDGELSCIVE